MEIYLSLSHKKELWGLTGPMVPTQVTNPDDSPVRLLSYIKGKRIHKNTNKYTCRHEVTLPPIDGT